MLGRETSKPVGSADRQIRLHVDREVMGRERASATNGADSRLPRKASSQNCGVRTANRHWWTG